MPSHIKTTFGKDFGGVHVLSVAFFARDSAMVRTRIKDHWIERQLKLFVYVLIVVTRLYITKESGFPSFQGIVLEFMNRMPTR